MRGVCLKISYKKLWMLLIKKDITKVMLRRDLGIAPGTMSKLNKGEEVFFVSAFAYLQIFGL